MIQIIIVLSIVAVVALIGNYFSNSSRIDRKIRNQSHQSICHFPDASIGRVLGKAIFTGTYIKAPVSGENVLYSRVTIFKEVGRSALNNPLVQIFEKKQSEFFVIQDATGFALVYVKYAKEIYKGETEYNSSFSYIPPVNPAKFLADHHIVSGNNYRGNNYLIVKEFLLKEKMEISVVGKGYWVSTTQLGLSLPVNRVLVFGMKSEDELYITNRPIK
jgi:hypothetical protein